ncbi:TonB-dependent receptor [Blastomonas sp.]|uniref:TonB-dependent receptor n=1 Tax=Blastomonas sp. TaxID=1909299 RepID=UPI00391D48F4
MKFTETRLKSILLSGAALGTLAMPGTAMAQDAAQGADNVDTNVIIVTASKRETTLQETPIAVSVTSGEDIEDAQIRDLIDLQTLVPSLRVSQLQSSANTNFIIRGFGNGANNPGIEPSVGVFIDGVYRSRSAAQIGDLPNIQRVEVLRGPQSTLFGKNASAGIISIVTERPQFQFGGSVEATYGNFDARILKADITGPISDTLAFSVAGNINKRDGFARDLNLGIKFNDRDRWGVRGQLLWEPNSDLSVRLIGDYDKIDENCCIAANIRSVPGIFGALQLASGDPRPIEPQSPFSYNVRNNFASLNEIENYGGSVQADYNLGAVSLTSITAYREVRSFTDQDSDFTSADLIGENSADTAIKTFTQEVRVASDFDGPLNFLLGGFYFNEKINVDNALAFGSDFRTYANALAGGQLPFLEQGILGVPLGTFFQQGQGLFDSYDYKNDSYSIFGQVDFKPIDRLTLTFGFNYTKDKKRVSSDAVSTDAFSALDLVGIGNTVITQQGIATTVGQALGLPGQANAAQIGAFAAANPAAFGQIQAGSAAFARANNLNPAVNPLLAFRPLQFLPPFLNFPNAVENGRTSDDDFAYTIRANFEVTDNINIYATYATGFKASSFNLGRDSRPSAAVFIPGSPVNNPAASPIRDAGLALPNLTTGSRFAGPENSEVYEAGLKAQWPLVAFNLAVFKQSIKGFQSNIFTGTGFALANAGEQSTFGIEFDGTVQPARGVNIFVAMTYLDPTYDSFVNSAFGDLSGTTPAGIPALSASMGASFTHEFDNGMTLSVRGDYAYESRVQIIEGLNAFGPGNQQAGAREFTREVNLINASTTLELANGLAVSLWARNLLDAQYITTVFDSVAQSGSVSGYPNQPRTYGGTVRFKF